jgi:linoleoyl-CoA desaturase
MSRVTFNNKNKPFKEALDSRIHAYFSQNQISEKGNWKLFTKSVILIPAAIITLLAALLIPMPLVWLYVLAATEGFILALIGFNVMHDGCHESYSKNKFINEAMGFTINLMGGNQYIWKIKHNIIHHTYTNINGIDDDIAKTPIFRFSPHQQKRWFHKYQHIYMFVLYALGSVSWTFFNDYQKYFTGKITGTPMKKMPTKDVIIFWTTKAANLFIFLVLPIMIFGPGVGVAFFFIKHAALGFTLSFVFQMAHCVSDARFPEPDPHSNKIENEWALHQVATTANFSMNSKLVSWIVGGLNYQIEHHLFPRVSHVHYPAISKLVKETCEEFDVPYTAYPTFAKAFASHVKHMREMGR